MNHLLSASKGFAARPLVVVAAITVSTAAATIVTPPRAPSAVAQGVLAPKAVGKAAASNREGDIHIRNSPLGRAVSEQNQGVHRVTKDVRITQDNEDFILYCDDLTFFEKENAANATENPHVESRDSTIIGDKMRAEFDEKTIVISGAVTMKSHGPKDGLQSSTPGKSLRDKALHKASTLTCTRIDYNYETRQAIISGNIRMRSGDSYGTCDQIQFDEANNIVHLMGHVQFFDGRQQSFRTGDLTIWLDSNVIATEKSVGITVIQKPSNKPKLPKPKLILGIAPQIPKEVYAANGLKPGPAPTPPAVDEANDIIAPPVAVEAAPDESASTPTAPDQSATGASTSAPAVTSAPTATGKAP